MAKRIPIGLGRSIKRNEDLLRRIVNTKGRKQRQLLTSAPKTLFTTIQRLFRNILSGVIPIPYTLRNPLIKRVAGSSEPDQIIQQSGSGVGAILGAVLPTILSLVIPQVAKLFKKKKKKLK